jgi:hypothetical protein
MQGSGWSKNIQIIRIRIRNTGNLFSYLVVLMKTKELKIKSSVINLSAEVRIYRELAHTTGNLTTHRLK